MDRYSEQNIISEGRFGQVTSGVDENGLAVAIKKVYPRKGRQMVDHWSRSVAREVKTMEIIERHGNQENVLRLLDHFETNSYFVLVFPLCAGDLSMLPEPSVDTARAVARMLLLGLDFLHSTCHIMHRDLKPANVLITSAGVAQIGDFGSAAPVVVNPVDPYTREVSTRWYKAPELLYGAYMYTETVDLWSFGCIVAELLTHKPLFGGVCDINQLCNIFDKLGTIDVEDWPEAKDLPDYRKIFFEPREPLGLPIPAEHLSMLEEVLHLRPDRRVAAKTLLAHSWLAGPVPSKIPIPVVGKREPSWKMEDIACEFNAMEQFEEGEFSEIVGTLTPPLTDFDER
eukprot:GEMP01071550.1.p1 GENE.GEMP01071550.1~~GEMP01071550.1.p1  ORF type:complete len:342 (+),score=77.47 GEMP01071550.1:97-1122(+)